MLRHFRPGRLSDLRGEGSPHSPSKCGAGLNTEREAIRRLERGELGFSIGVTAAASRAGANHPYGIPEVVTLGAERHSSPVDRLQEHQQVRLLLRGQRVRNRGRRRKRCPLGAQPV